MQHTTRTLLLLLCIAAMPAFAQQTILRKVQVIDNVQGSISGPADVYISGAEIEKITQPTNDTPAGYTVVDCSGKYVLPGFWDMHVHSWWDKHFLDWYLKFGVTGIRNMFTPPAMLFPVRDSIRAGLKNGPLIYGAGMIVDGPDPAFSIYYSLTDVSEVDSIVQRCLDDKVDFIKVYDAIPKEAYLGLMQKAREVQIPVCGHVPVAVSANEAAAAGQRSIEHMFGIPELCLSHAIEDSLYFDHWFKSLLNPGYQQALREHAGTCDAAFEVLQKHHTYWCPTLVIHDVVSHPLSNHSSDSAFSWLPSDIVDYWKPYMEQFRQLPEPTYADLEQNFEYYKQIVKAAYAAGVPLLIGTDFPNPWLLPGMSLHDEMGLFATLGIPNKDIIRMATYHPAEYFGITAQYGSVKAQKIANLVVLEANPFEDIRNTRKIAYTIVQGKVLDPDTIDLADPIHHR